MIGLGLNDQSHAHDVWNELVTLVQSANQNAGTINLATLPITLTEKFKPLRFGISADIEKLKDHSERIFAAIQNKIGVTHIERSDLVDQLISLVETTDFILINGARGLGKSALAKEFAEKIGQEYPVFCLRAEDLDKSHLDEVFTSMRIQSTFKELSAYFSLIPKKVLIIESSEKILELTHKTAFIYLLQFLKQSTGWTVIATGRDYAYPQITFNYLQPENINWASLSLEPLTDNALEIIQQNNPNLTPLIENPTLNQLLRIPFWAQLAIRATQSGAQFNEKSTENSFRNAVWDSVISNETDKTDIEIPLLRKHTFIDVAVKRAKAMDYGVSERDFNLKALIKLADDNLLIRDKKRMLVSPAHDVLEDWALEEYIETAYNETDSNFADFIGQVGHEPAIKRAFRLWLHRCLNEPDRCAELESLIVKALASKSIRLVASL